RRLRSAPPAAALEFQAGATRAWVIAPDFGVADWWRGFAAAGAEFGDLSQQEGRAGDRFGGFVEAILDIVRELDRLAFDVHEADKRGEDDLGAFVGEKRAPVRGSELHGPPEPANPRSDLVMGWPGIRGAAERRAIVTDPLGLEPAEALLDVRAERIEHHADRGENRLLQRVVKHRLLVGP